MFRIATSRFAIVAAVALGIAGGTVATSPNAAAAQVYRSPFLGDGVVIIELTHDETVAAARVGAGHVVNAALGNDRWGVLLEEGSRYRGTVLTRPDRARSWNTVNGQQVIAEAAEHRNGRVVLGVFLNNPSLPLWVMQDW